MSVSRRTAIRGAVWTVPVVAVAAQAPAFAASICAQVPYSDAGWNFVTSSPGSLSGSGTNGLVDDPTSGQLYLSEKDNTTILPVTITGTRQLVLVAGRAYTFTYTVRSRFASSGRANSENQFLRVQIGSGLNYVDMRHVKSNTGGSQLLGLLLYDALLSPVETNTYQTFSFTFTPTAAQTTSTLTYTFTLPGRGLLSAFSDVAITAPVISGQGC